ncbi:restriction endonuclease subunit S [Acinetobacter johnsonii]|uniref:restriction endonuclease subunit S n=1 Tax=Acinetobacter johnsonii TaxID=40214 RepID=UPI0029354161|nr:restriction endonuclease subunit S [Acinetobacter johnsonii]MDV2488227.1 restriction endonuclease subunit S [Acinetobacter johnsonii]
MAKYQKYAECKDSGVEWLGEIPSHWEMWKLSHAYNEIGSGTTPSTSNEENFEGDIPWVTTGELRENIILDTKKKVSQKTIELFPTLRKYPSGSVAIAMYGATIGRLGILGVEATTNQACCVMTTSKVLDNKYLFYWLQAFKNEIIQLSSGGGQPNINQEKVASLKISAPLVEDQVTIVNFLDHETAKIDSLISKQEKLIELLKEKRQAVISHAVTKGLDPNVPMKDSGVEWLGQVPEHWLKTKLVGVADGTKGCFVNGPFGSDLLANELQDEGVPVVYIRDIKPTGYKRKSTVHVTDKKALQLEVCKLEANDVIISKVGDPPGDACLYPENEPSAIITQDVIRIRVNKIKFEPMYLVYLLNSDFGRTVMDNISVEGTRKRVSLGDFKATKFVLPTLEEQRVIITFLKNECQKIDSIYKKAIHSISLSQERRTALISAAVTGKIDVRNWQNPNKNNEAKMEFSA